MKGEVRFPFREFALALSSLAAGSAKAEFDGPYSLTPPAPGLYSGIQLPAFTGNWTAAAANGWVNTFNAPLRLELSVPAGSIFANQLRFSTHAAAGGTVSFDSTAVIRTDSPGSSFIEWFRQPTGGNLTSVPLDQGTLGQPAHFDFPVQAGDVFGFRLGSGSDAIGGLVLVHTLTVENFIAPVPEPGAWALLVASAALAAARARFRSYCRRCKGLTQTARVAARE